MREALIRAVQNPRLGAYLEDTDSSSYAFATGVLFVFVIVALSATGFSLILFVH